MTEKTLYYARMAEEAATQITASREKWTSFLRTAGRLYKYPYEEQLMINAQRPDATACAEYDLWNNVMHRYVKRGSKGIALLDNSGDTPRLRYVFDISDTGERAISRPVQLMRVTDENRGAIEQTLTEAFSLASESTLEEKVMEATEKLAAEYWDEHGAELLAATKGSYLENYDDFNVGISFRRAAAASIAYTVLTRCTDDPDVFFDHEDFLDIFDFNTRQTANALGTATSAVSAQIFREIEIAIRNIDRIRAQEQNEDKEVQEQASQPLTQEENRALESGDAERSSDERIELSEERGLSDSGRETDTERADDDTVREVRQDAQNIPEGAPSDDVQRHGVVGDPVPAPDRSAGDSTEADRSDHEGTDSVEPGTGQEDGQPRMGGTHEQPESGGGGERDDGADLHVIVEGEQLSLFPTEQEQIERIDSVIREAEDNQPSAFSLPEDDLDNDLLRGSQFEGGKMRIYALYQHEASASVRAEFLRKEYGLGGHSQQLMSGESGFVDYNGRGVLIHSFRSDYEVRYTWREAEKRIKRLIDTGVYLNDRDREKWAELEEKYAEVGGVPYPDPAYRMKEPEELISVPNEAQTDISSPEESEDTETVQTHGDRTAEYDDTIVELRDENRAYLNYLSDPDVPDEEKIEYRSKLRANEAEISRLMLEKAESEITAEPEVGNVYLDEAVGYTVVTSRDEDSDTVGVQIFKDAELTELVGGGGAGRLNVGRLPFVGRVEEMRGDREIIYPGEERSAEQEPVTEEPFRVGDTITLEGTEFIIEEVGINDITMRDPKLLYPVSRVESRESLARLIREEAEKQQGEPVALKEVVIDLTPREEVSEQAQEAEHASVSDIKRPEAKNFRITDDDLGTGGAKEKFRRNMDAIYLLKILENEGRDATPEEQAVLSQYVGWGGLADAFDPDKRDWTMQYQELQAALTEEEYKAARASTLNAHYTSPTVIRSIYDVVEQMGFQTGNILEPSMGVGNFFGLLPESMQGSNLYGVELDSITGRIAQKLYPEADITVGGFETTDNRDFFDLAIGNVPFGNYKVNDKPYNKLNFNIHNYFFAKALDQVRPGGIVAFVTSRYTMDSVSPEVRKYLAQRAELLGAIRLPNNAFKANAGTEVVSDIIFLQKRERPIDIEPDWVHRDTTPEGFTLNSYFAAHPEMVLGELSSESTQYGSEELTVRPREGDDLAQLLKDAVKLIRGEYREAEIAQDDFEQVSRSIPADPTVKNYSYTIVAGEVFFRENSIMTPADLGETEKERVKGMIALRGIVNDLIEYQLQDYPDEEIRMKQEELNTAYDRFVEKHGLINSSANARAFSDDSSYYLLCSLEDIDDDGQFKGKADMFTKRTIRPERTVTSVDTPSEALAVSISERGRVDLPFMAELIGTPDVYDRITEELSGVIFKDPLSGDTPETGWQTADEYLSGNVREKLKIAEMAAESENGAGYRVNVEALKQAQPKDLDATEIDIRLGATWIDRDYIQQFMYETFNPPFYWHRDIQVKYSDITAEWQITGKTKVSRHNVEAYVTYGTDRANAYRILEETLNLKDIRIYDTYEDVDGKKKRVLNKKETTLAQQKQAAIKEAFRDWIWKDPERREALVKRYNELFNSTKPREYDGSHIHFVGMNPEIKLRDHQRGAIAHVIYGGNTLLAHEVGAGKTFEMAAAAMESKRLGLCQKSMFVVPNHLTLQWANEFMRLYPSAKILVANKKDFETKNRKKFCARIASGDYDAVIIGHSQFEKIPISAERQERLLQEQIDEIEAALAEMKASHGEHFSIKQMEKTRKSLQARMDKLMDMDRKDDVVTFEQLGVDRLFVDESQAYKNLFLYTKMRNVAGLSTSESQRAADMFMKCRFMDEMTGGRGVVFASGTPVSNSMTELYSVMRYLQYGTLQQKNLTHFDCWASTFGETTTSIELAPEGSGYRARTRFAKFFNLPELMNMFKEVADIKMADQLHLKVPEAEFETVLVQPSEHQKEMVKALSERAAAIHAGHVDPSEDNMLKVTSDGRKIGLDQRLMNELLPDDPNSKLNACVRNVLQIWEEGKAEKLTQLVFSDMSTPKTDGTFSVYDDIKKKLIEGGVPEEEIAFIHDADTEAKKKELFSKVRKGKVRVLLGSTQKMGAGTNVQDRLYAVHHLDVGWRPSDMTQRNGRIIRQGNECKSVKIFQYVTEGTFDAYLYQTLENKQKFISQIMTSKSPVRSCEDVDEQVLSYAEVKALCAGNPLIKQKMDLDIDVARLKVLKADHQSKQYRLEDQLLKHYPAEIEKTIGFINGLTKDIETVAAHPQDKENFCGMTVNGTVFAEKEMAGAALIDQCHKFKGTEPVLIGEYRGFQMYLSFDSFRKEYDLTLKGEMRHHVYLGSDARGNIQRLDNALQNIPERLERTKNTLETLQKEQESARAELGKPFPQEEELKEKSARLAELDAQLNLDEQDIPGNGEIGDGSKGDGDGAIGDGDTSDGSSDLDMDEPEDRPSVLETLHRLSGQLTAQDDRIIARAEVTI